MIGTRIKKIRETRKFSQDFVAKKIGVTQTVYSKIESNATKVSIERLQAISEVLEVPVEELIANDSSTFNIYNNKVGYAVYQANKEIYEATFKIFQNQITALVAENEKLRNLIIEKLSDKK